MTIGILGYGSLISNPGSEIAAAMTGQIPGVRTPFTVEFSRTSRVRHGAPTLVPVETGGGYVQGVVLVLDERTAEMEARDMLYRRERNRVETSDVYAEMDPAHPDSAVVGRLNNFAGLTVVLYAALRPNISQPTPAHLAKLAIESARSPSGEARRDGISYLLAAIRDGVRTPLMPEYEREILRQTGATLLAEAWHLVRNQRKGMSPIKD
jgi:cation transport regulator ChaC